MMQRHKVIVFDLDDTLYKEIDFLISAYKEIGRFFETEFGKKGLWAEMFRYYREDLDAFEEIINTFHIPVEKDFLIKMYREHHPTISLADDTKMVLEALKQTENCDMALITDGRIISQMNKIEALGLDDYFHRDNILISDVVGHEKPDEFSYRWIETLFKGREYVYVGDNPEKDFFAPNRMGWNTVCLLDDGRNIHKQNFNLAKNFLPQRRISKFTEILGMV